MPTSSRVLGQLMSGHIVVAEPELNDFIRPSIGTYTFSEASQEFIKTKFLACCSGHSLCGISEGGFAPTRLLDLGDSNTATPNLGTGIGTVRLLCNAASLRAAQRYATLSHCWGTLRIKRLTTANLDELGRGFRIDTLQPTFQHAIQAVRMLGLRYLWIDSLCIMQDSAADWEAESALMGSVYGNACINLAAASSVDARGGLFFDRDPVVVQPFAAYSAPPASNGSQGTKALRDGWYVWQNDGRWASVGDEPLHRRGWVLQERLLSNRTVHFTQSEVFWHCLEDLGSESVPNQVQNDRLAMPVMQIRDYTDIRISMAKARSHGWSKMSPESKAKLHKDWGRVLGHYSMCGLTKEEDKLVAIFGIANNLEHLLGDQCLAGLWRSRMPYCLLWFVDWDTADVDGRVPSPAETARQMPSRWRAPTWSWASLNLAINYPVFEADAQCHSRVIGVSVARRENGSAICGRLTIQGPVVEVDVGIVQGEIAARWCDGFVGLGLEGKSKRNARFHVRTDGTYVSASPTRALLILEDWAYIFLLIEPAEPTGVKPGVFRRSGVLLMIPDDDAEPDWEPLEETVVLI